jgi:hypothetical protein
MLHPEVAQLYFPVKLAISPLREIHYPTWRHAGSIKKQCTPHRVRWITDHCGSSQRCVEETWIVTTFKLSCANVDNYTLHRVSLLTKMNWPSTRPLVCVNTFGKAKKPQRNICAQATSERTVLHYRTTGTIGGTTCEKS